MKFAVKEIQCKDEKNWSETQGEKGKTDELFDNIEEEFEEYEEVESIMKPDEEIPANEDEVKRCRFCWMTECDDSNPLFTSCKCSGSVGFIHFNCLRNWLDVKK